MICFKKTPHKMVFKSNDFFESNKIYQNMMNYKYFFTFQIDYNSFILQKRLLFLTKLTEIIRV
ncbi:hypothetical protein EG341_11615 [Chryseobacterium lactis]|nr:hypothetical protein EG341_11615 [Chryseobacterium lactis]